MRSKPFHLLGLYQRSAVLGFSPWMPNNESSGKYGWDSV